VYSIVQEDIVVPLGGAELGVMFLITGLAYYRYISEAIPINTRTSRQHIL